MSRRLPELWLLRHGQTEWNAAGRLQGRLDSPLTETGVLQARAQGAILRRILPAGVTVLSSTADRAWRTAQIATEGLGLTVLPDPDLQEIDLGDWSGRQIKDLRAELPDLAADDPHLWKFDAPGGEGMAAMTARLERVLARLDGPTVLFTHGVTSRVLRCLALGRPASDLALMPGGQGMVYHLRDGVARTIAQ